MLSISFNVSLHTNGIYFLLHTRSRCGDRDEPSPKRIKTEENLFDIQEALQAIHMRQSILREQLACAKSKGEEIVGRNLQVTYLKNGL